MTAAAAVRRDYSLTGPEAGRAAARGLVEAQWYRPPIDPDRLHELTARANRRAAADTALWLGLLAGAGALAWLALGSWWAVPAFAAYGALYGGASDSRWHEMGHGTAFRTGWLNDAVYCLASFMMLREPTVWRWSHARHHTDTIVVGRDPEIAFPRPTSRWLVAATFLGLRTAPSQTARIFRHAAGRLDADVADFVPRSDWARVKWEARAFAAVLLGAGAWAAAAWSVVPLLYVGLPTMYGFWLVVFFGLTQHAGLREDVLDHRLNTRTVYMNPVFRFLYSNMNYHVEHHMFPTVPYHALPALHAEVGRHLAPPAPNTVAAYREILGSLARQARDPAYEADRPVPEAGPSSGGPGRIDVGQYLWSGARSGRRFDLGPAADLAAGQMRRVDVDDRTFAVCRLDDGAIAVTDGICTHGRAHLAEGRVEGCEIECPKHNGRFDARTGEAVRRPARTPIAVYEAEVADGRILSSLTPRHRGDGPEAP